MREMRSIGAVITEIIEEYGQRNGQWVSVAEIATARGLSTPELREALEELMGDADFAAEPRWNNLHVTQADRRHSPVVGGEPRHLIKWS